MKMSHVFVWYGAPGNISGTHFCAMAVNVLNNINKNEIMKD